MNGFWDMSIFMAPIRKHFRAQNLSGPNFFSENIPGVLKHILTRRWAKSDKKVLVFIFCQTPTLFRPKNGTLQANLRVSHYWQFIIGILCNLNPQLEKKLLNSFWEKHHFVLKTPFKTEWTQKIFELIPMHISNFSQIAWRVLELF